MRLLALHLIAAIVVRAAILAVALVLVISCALLWRPAAAQTPATKVVGYGRAVTGEVTSPRGQEHTFTGCVGERVNVTVTAGDAAGARFAPRVEIYDTLTGASIATAVAGANRTSIRLDTFELPASGNYGIAVNGRSRADRGPYSLTLDLNLPAGTPPNDGVLTLNMLYGDVVSSTLEADRSEHWNFRGCDGDEILVEVTTEGFVPQVELLAPVAEFPIASAAVEVTGNQAHAILTRTLPANGEYNLIVSGASALDAGAYSLRFTLAERAASTIGGPTAIATTAPTVTPTVTPTVASTSGPRARRGIPTPQAPTPQPNETPVATATRRVPTATPMPTASLTPTPTEPPAATAPPFLPSDKLEAFCTVTTDRLNLRPGPGTNFNPPITILETGAFLVVTGRNADSSWLQVAVLDDNLVVEFTGWVSADFVFCVGNLDAAPVMEGAA